MEKKSNVLNINNIDKLKVIFSYLDSQYILKLIKYNKKIQNELGIKLENYKNNLNNPKYIIQKEIDYEDRDFYHFHYKKPEEFNGEAELGLFGLIFCSTFIYFIYILVYSLLLFFKNSFNENNTLKEKYKEKSNTIHNINLSLFGLILYIIIGFILFIILLLCENDNNNYKRDWRNIIKIILKILLILYNLIIILFEILIIWKLILSYEIIKGNIIWCMIMDYIFLIFNFIYILFILYMTYLYIYYYIIHYDEYFYFNNITYSITSLNNIKIKKFKVSEDFIEMAENEKKKFLLDNYNNMEYMNSVEEKNLINLINEFREKNNLPKFLVNNSFKLPNYIIKQPSEIMINPQQNLFEKSNKKYLFRYPIGEFEKNFNNENPDIISVLLNKNLNSLQIITKDNIEFIYVYQKSLNNI